MQKWWLFASEWWPTGSSDGKISELQESWRNITVLHTYTHSKHLLGIHISLWPQLHDAATVVSILTHNRVGVGLWRVAIGYQTDNNPGTTPVPDQLQREGEGERERGGGGGKGQGKERESVCGQRKGFIIQFPVLALSILSFLTTLEYCFFSETTTQPLPLLTAFRKSHMYM